MPSMPPSPSLSLVCSMSVSWQRIGTALANILGAMLMVGCAVAQHTTEARPRFIDSKDRGTAIIFVHGYLGDATQTWTNPHNGAYFPRLVQTDPAFGDVDVFVHEYSTPLIGDSLRLDELAENMRLVLSRHGVLARERLVFVAHSMGGLVTRAFLLKYRDAARRTSLMYLFASPTSGSDVARIGSLFSTSGHMRQLVSTDPTLGDLQRSWLADDLLRVIPTYCAYERRATLGGIVVEDQSAMNLCNRPVDPIEANHLDIVKPASRDHTSYSALANAFRSEQARVSQKSVPEGARPSQASPPTVSIQQKSTGRNSPNILGNNNSVIINPPANPYLPNVTYDFNGTKHIAQGNRFEAIAG